MPRTLILQQAVVLLVMCVIGCSSSDERYAELSHEAVKRQAEQNAQIARQSQEVAEAAHELVEADALPRHVPKLSAGQSFEISGSTHKPHALRLCR